VTEEKQEHKYSFVQSRKFITSGLVYLIDHSQHTVIPYELLLPTVPHVRDKIPRFCSPFRVN
jgi:hypothetical protein